MKLQTKALFNLIRMRKAEGENLATQPWQVEDLRQVSAGELFNRLVNLGVKLDKPSFLRLIDESETPEELAARFYAGLREAEQDYLYLIIFELWRKLSAKLSLSLFCDELDHRIFLYDADINDSDELVQSVLSQLSDLLSKSMDNKIHPTAAFLALQQHVAHDLEGFLYDYIFDQIESNNLIYASELLDDFYPFVEGCRWFDFLRIYLISASDPQEVDLLIKKLLCSFLTETDLDLQIEVLKFMVHACSPELFLKLLKITLPCLRIENDLKEVLEIAADFFRRLDRDEMEHKISDLLKQRIDIPLDQEIGTKDPGLLLFFRQFS